MKGDGKLKAFEKVGKPLSIALPPLCFLILLGCGGRPLTYGGAAPTSAGTASHPKFSLNTPVEEIAADQRGEVILIRDVPGLMASKSYILFDDMTLSQIATVSGGRLTKAKLDLVQADLANEP
jgi:hypothetical protein